MATPDPTRGNHKLTAPRRCTDSVHLLESGWKFLGQNSICFLRTDSGNNFEIWQKDVVSHFRFDIGKDHSGGAQNDNGSNSSVELEPLLSTFAGPETSNCPSKNRGWFTTNPHGKSKSTNLRLEISLDRDSYSNLCPSIRLHLYQVLNDPTFQSNRFRRIARAGGTLATDGDKFISHKVFLKAFCKSQFPHKSVKVFFISVIVKDKLTDLWGG